MMVSRVEVRNEPSNLSRALFSIFDTAVAVKRVQHYDFLPGETAWKCAPLMILFKIKDEISPCLWWRTTHSIPINIIAWKLWQAISKSAWQVIWPNHQSITVCHRITSTYQIKSERAHYQQSPLVNQTLAKVTCEQKDPFDLEKPSVLLFFCLSFSEEMLFWYNRCYSSFYANIVRSHKCCFQMNSHFLCWLSHVNNTYSCQRFSFDVDQSETLGFSQKRIASKPGETDT